MIYLILALIFYTASLLIGASASRNANTNLVTAVNTFISAIIPFIIIAPLLSKKTFVTQKYGILMAALSGIIVSLFVLTLSKSFTQNKIGIITPVIFGGAILFTTILSYFLFKEKITITEGIGLGLVLAGLVVVIYARATI
ncbi:MAG: EamA family transporter [Patescibacteria group bacterium]